VNSWEVNYTFLKRGGERINCECPEDGHPWGSTKGHGRKLGGTKMGRGSKVSNLGRGGQRGDVQAYLPWTKGRKGTTMRDKGCCRE